MLKNKRKLDYIYLAISIVIMVVVFIIFKKWYGLFFLYGFSVMSIIIENQIRTHLKDIKVEKEITALSVVGSFGVRFLLYVLTLGIVAYFFGVVNLCIAALGLASYRQIFFTSLR